MSAVRSKCAEALSDRQLTLTRIFDAPCERVFRAWIEPELLKRWSAPRNFTVIGGSGELRPGGLWQCHMRSSEGVDFRVGGIYREIVPPERLVFTHAWDGEAGKPGTEETLVTVTLEDADGKTLLTFRQEGFDSRGSRDGHREGWSECFDLLAELLADA